jgi:hypothetical protein
MGIKMQNLMLILNPKKLHKDSMRKKLSAKKLTENGVLQKFWPITSFGRIFCIFSLDSNSASNFAFMILIVRHRPGPEWGT